MMGCSGTRWGVALIAVILLSLVRTAAAARVEDLYEATVPVAGASPEAAQAAFADALRRVLVKVSGRASIGEDPAVQAALGDPAALVQQYRRDGAGGLWTQFEAAALRRRLGSAGVPIWGDDRPLTVVWLAYEAGGERDVLGSAGPDGALPAALRRDLLGAAAARGVPVALPLRDAREVSALGYADLWGESGNAVVRASARYAADAVLLGRARLAGTSPGEVRWTLMLGDERMEWRGTVADGPRGLAERLSQRLAATMAPAATGPVRLAVSGVGSLRQYGQLLTYLQGLDVIGSLGLGYVAGETMVFDLQLRGDREQLTRALAARRVVEPDGAAAVVAPAGATPDLSYRLLSGS
jgi:hypothetical protein